MICPAGSWRNLLCRTSALIMSKAFFKRENYNLHYVKSRTANLFKPKSRGEQLTDYEKVFLTAHKKGVCTHTGISSVHCC